MSVAKVGFSLMPFNFFDGTPALDVPPTEEHCNHPPA
jgi:Cu2+-containing amine oxidase